MICARGKQHPIVLKRRQLKVKYEDLFKSGSKAEPKVHNHDLVILRNKTPLWFTDKILRKTKQKKLWKIMVQ